MESNRTYRVRTKVDTTNSDKYIVVDLDNDIDVLQILSLDINATGDYNMHTADYGCLVGRVQANGGVGVPNAKISIFIPVEEADKLNDIIYGLYPYTTQFDKNSDTIRYNLLPSESVSECHAVVGTFPSKTMTLDDDHVIEVFDKYYKYTTRTNASGDYMMLGLPTGQHEFHMDVDLSDIGWLSQRPRDMIYKGYNINQFENANKFKTDTNLDNLVQIKTSTDTVYIYPFWGESEMTKQVGITRHDVDLDYKFEPTCIFMGSMITDERSQGISKRCIPSDRMGKMDRLTTGSGTIEMIRKTIDGEVESFSVQGNQLIDGDGTWCYQIPMNLDYMKTDEYGNLVPSDNPEVGFPMRTRVRFRLSLTDFQSDYENNHIVKVLVPNNPQSGMKEADYEFGTYTKDREDGTGSFRDLMWNNIYTVKQYIPRFQRGNYQRNKKFSGIKNINVNGSNNPLPYNNMRVDLTFMFVLQCAILKIILWIISFINSVIIPIQNKLSSMSKSCSVVGDGICPDLEGWYFAPKCNDSNILSTTLSHLKSDMNIDEHSVGQEIPESLCLTSRTNYLMQCVEINLAMEYEVIQFDFYNDWINGLVYIPRWFVNIRKKRSILFGLIKIDAKTESCMDTNYRYGRFFTQQCALDYNINNNAEEKVITITTDIGCGGNNRCHKYKGRKRGKVFGSYGGIIHKDTTTQGHHVYYAKPCEWHNNKKIPIYGTDIVSLGSIVDCDIHGIPKAFEELTSSTFLMPSNLVSTNLANLSYMYYGNSLGSGVICSGNSYKATRVPLTVQQNKQSNYVIWNTQDSKGNEDIDNYAEYAVSEYSGIDWGFVGPNQNNVGLSDFKLKDNGTDLQAGGHFLGISCVNSQVNIKSCMNLARICEFGAMMSQRQNYLKSVDYSKSKKYNLIDDGTYKFEGKEYFRYKLSSGELNNGDTLTYHNSTKSYTIKGIQRVGISKSTSPFVEKVSFIKQEVSQSLYKTYYSMYGMDKETYDKINSDKTYGFIKDGVYYSIQNSRRVNGKFYEEKEGKSLLYRESTYAVLKMYKVTASLSATGLTTILQYEEVTDNILDGMSSVTLCKITHQINWKSHEPEMGLDYDDVLVRYISFNWFETDTINQVQLSYILKDDKELLIGDEMVYNGNSYTCSGSSYKVENGKRVDNVAIMFNNYTGFDILEGDLGSSGVIGVADTHYNAYLFDNQIDGNLSDMYIPTENIYRVPDGFISGYDINDSNFRTIFATLNYNRLKTRLNTENMCREYDLSPMKIWNFDGSMHKHEGKRIEFHDDEFQEFTSSAMAFGNRDEKFDKDYYMFRMGIDNMKEVENKYLIDNGNSYSIPLYENSFYFYFGLHDGNTAIDRFFVDFYGSCNTEEN